MTTRRKSSFARTYSRVGAHNYIELDTLAAPANVKQFVEEMLAHLIDQNQANQRIQSEGLPSTTQTYPFTATAFELLCDYACQDAVKSTRATSSRPSTSVPSPHGTLRTR